MLKERANDRDIRLRGSGRCIPGRQRANEGGAGIVLDQSNRESLRRSPEGGRTSSSDQTTREMRVTGIRKCLNKSRVKTAPLRNLPCHIDDGAAVIAQDKTADALHSAAEGSIRVLCSCRIRLRQRSPDRQGFCDEEKRYPYQKRSAGLMQACYLHPRTNSQINFVLQSPDEPTVRNTFHKKQAGTQINRVDHAVGKPIAARRRIRPQQTTPLFVDALVGHYQFCIATGDISAEFTQEIGQQIVVIFQYVPELPCKRRLRREALINVSRGSHSNLIFPVNDPFVIHALNDFAHSVVR